MLTNEHLCAIILMSYEYICMRATKSVKEGIKMDTKTKFCKHCGAKIPEDAVICSACGRQVEELKSASAQPSIVINNENTNMNTNTNINAAFGVRVRNKWVALLLCFFLGFVGAHKFYEGKTGLGILYLFTGGLFGIGVVMDFIVLLFKPNAYYIR